MPSPGRYLHWDCETRATVDLRATGAYVYAAHPSTSVTVARLALDREAPEEWRPGWDLAPKYLEALADPNVEVVAHNAAFERLMLEHILHPRHGWPKVSIDRWICTMARCRAMALPGALDNAAIAAGLDIKKDNAGRQLMLRMCRPRAFNPDGSPVWWEDEDRMARLSDYCATDVKVERALMLATVPLPIDELDVWDLTEVMNDRGVRFDLDFVRAARAVALTTTGMLDRQIAEITDGVVMKVSEIGALKTWLHRRGVDLSPPPELVRGPVGVVLDTLTEASAEASEVAELERAIGVDDEVEAEESLPELRRRDIIRLLADPRVGAVEKRALRCRFEGGKISVKKLDAIVNRADAGGVVRGLLSYHGASTGRYISQGLQVQNFPRDVVHDWDGHRTLLDHGAAMVDAIGGPPLDVISRMLRGAIIPRDGHEIATCDFSSVEAVGVAWLAGQSDLVDAFRSKRKIYEEMAGAVYNRRASDIAKDSTERQVGKTLVLGAGYQMGWWKFRETALVQAGVLLSPEEAAHAIDTYRQTFPEIPKLWRQLNRAAIRAVKNPGLVVDAAGGKIRFRRDPLWLRMRLPGGRYLWYARPLIEKGRFDTDTVTYMSVNAKTRRWERTQTYGGRLTENCISIGTPILTDRGWQPIETVRLADRLWDGEAWVRHAGLIAKGEQDIIEVDGVGMTPDHEVLTTEGWRSGASCDGLDRAPVALPDSAVSRWEHATRESPLVLPLRVRRDDDRRRGGYPQGQAEVLRLPDAGADLSRHDNARYDEPSGFQGVAFDERPLPAADASGMAELRCTGDYSLPGMAGQLRGVLDRHGSDVSAGADPGAHRQHARLFGGELRVAHAEGTGAEHSGQCADQHPMGPYAHRGSGGTQWYREDDAILSPESGRARVYDVLNAGPRHRFVVAGATGPLIVHNCVQGLCRDLLVRAAMGLEQAGYQPITLIHDEVVAEPPIGHGSVGEMCEIMCALPGWARGFPLSASGARGPRYIKT